MWVWRKPNKIFPESQDNDQIQNISKCGIRHRHTSKTVELTPWPETKSKWNSVVKVNSVLHHMIKWKNADDVNQLKKSRKGNRQVELDHRPFRERRLRYGHSQRKWTFSDEYSSVLEKQRNQCKFSSMWSWTESYKSLHTLRSQFDSSRYQCSCRIQSKHFQGMQKTYKTVWLFW